MWSWVPAVEVYITIESANVRSDMGRAKATKRVRGQTRNSIHTPSQNSLFWSSQHACKKKGEVRANHTSKCTSSGAHSPSSDAHRSTPARSLTSDRVPSGTAHPHAIGLVLLQHRVGRRAGRLRLSLARRHGHQPRVDLADAVDGAAQEGHEVIGDEGRELHVARAREHLGHRTCERRN
eukprot:602230-Prymnesium_polylepis.1